MNQVDESPSSEAKRPLLRKAVNYKLICLVLVVVLIGAVLLWKPWQTRVTNADRIITVTGEATVRATPDEYVFSPTYDFTDSDSKAALTELTTKSDEIVSHLKSLGVADSAIKTSSDGYSGGGGIYYPVSSTSSSDSTKTYNLSVTVTLIDTKLLQTVQAYLLTTSPTGSVSPTATFSAAKQKLLEGQARNQAEKDARAKANQSAQNLGFKVAAVKSVEDGSLDAPTIYRVADANLATGSVGQKAPTLAVQPGQNDLSYSVTVVYFIH